MEFEERMLMLKAGDKEMLSEIYDQTCRSVYAVAFSVLKNKESAKDIVQDTYCRIMLKINKYKPKGTPKAWICAIAKNLALNEYKRIRRERNNTVSYDAVVSSEDIFDNEGIFDTAKKTLDDTELEVVMLHAVGGLSHKESAVVIGKPYATVRWHYSVALKKLKDTLTPN